MCGCSNQTRCHGCRDNQPQRDSHCPSTLQGTCTAASDRVRVEMFLKISKSKPSTFEPSSRWQRTRHALGGLPLPDQQGRGLILQPPELLYMGSHPRRANPTEPYRTLRTAVHPYHDVLFLNAHLGLSGENIKLPSMINLRNLRNLNTSTCTPLQTGSLTLLYRPVTMIYRATRTVV